MPTIPPLVCEWEQLVTGTGREIDGATLRVFCDGDDIPVHRKDCRRPLSRITPSQREAIEARAVQAARAFLNQFNAEHYPT